MEYHCNEVASNSGMDVILEKKQEAILLFFKALVRPNLKSCIQFWSPCFKKDRHIRKGQKESNKNDRSFREPDLWGRLKELGLFSLESTKGET